MSLTKKTMNNPSIEEILALKPEAKPRIYAYAIEFARRRTPGRRPTSS